MATNSDSSHNKTQYHHFVPQFILRRFKIDRFKPIVPPGRPHGSGGSHKRKLTCKTKEDTRQSDPDILLYDLSTSKLSVCPIRRAFGEHNLYRDTRNSNPNHIEQSFSKLEGQACYIIDRIHGSMVTPSKLFEITRKDLRILRKFLHLQSYRGSYLAVTYQMGSHEPLRDWIAHVKRDKGLNGHAELWRDSMNYLLETPHEVLVEEGEEILNRLGQDTVNIMRKTIIDPDINWLALEYAEVARDYFLCICEASNDAEFVLGDNSFGIGDGYTSTGARLHKVFILSPRIAVVLRLINCDHSSATKLLPAISGTLSSIEMNPSSVEFAGFDPAFYPPDVALRKFEDYKLSPIASRDLYHFKIVKLTRDETQDVNAVVLYNLEKQGTLTFLSSKKMLQTLTSYRDTHEVDSLRFNNLLGTLKELSKKIPKPKPKSKSKPAPIVVRTSVKGTQLDVERRFEAALLMALTDVFPDSYPQASKLYHMALDDRRNEHSVAKWISTFTVSSILKFSRTLPQVPERVIQQSRRTVHTVEDIPKRVFDFFVHLAGSFEPHLTASSISARAYQVVIRAVAVGLIDWLIASRPDLLKEYGLAL